MAVSTPARTSPAQTSIPPPKDEQRLVLYAISWQDYLMIGEALRDRGHVRLTYDRGTLEIMTTSSRHEIYKKRFGRLLESLAEEFGLEIVPAGNMTFQREDLERALEPDECFWIANASRMQDLEDWDPERDPPPDLVLEIEISRGTVRRLPLYAALGLPEVWAFNGRAVRVLLLGPDGSYGETEFSPTFPGIPIAEMARFLRPAQQPGYMATVRAFSAWVREYLRKES